MSATLKIYDPDQISFSFTGIPLESGRGDGEFIKIEKVAAVFVTKRGVDGQVTRTKVNDPIYKVTARFMQTSSANIILSGLHLADQLAANGAGVGVLNCKDRQGTSVFLAPEAWIEKVADVMYDAEPTLREWVWTAICPPATSVVGSS